jgi:RND superfamily putative drug exporter
MAAFLGRLAAAPPRRWKRSLALVFATVLALGGLAATVGGEFVDDFTTPGTESQQADRPAAGALPDRFG